MAAEPPQPFFFGWHKALAVAQGFSLVKTGLKPCATTHFLVSISAAIGARSAASHIDARGTPGRVKLVRARVPSVFPNFNALRMTAVIGGGLRNCRRRRGIADAKDVAAHFFLSFAFHLRNLPPRTVARYVPREGIREPF